MLVNVFIPTYNAQVTLLDETLNSVLRQTYSDIELWLVDDASTDDTPKRLDEWAKRDSRIHVIHKKHDGSVPFAWNEVFPKLNGEFTLYMSHDDLLSEDCIEKLVKKQQEGDYDCVIPSCVGFEKDCTKPEDSFEEFNKKSNVSGRKVMSGREAFFEMLDYGIPGFALWRTDLIREIGMPTESFNSDEGMQRIWALHCKEVAFEGDAKFYYRMVAGSITKGLKPYHYGSLLTLLRLIERGRKLLADKELNENCLLKYRAFEKFARKSYVYLATMYLKNKRSYDNGERGNIEDVLEKTKMLFSSQIVRFCLPLIVNVNGLRK